MNATRTGRRFARSPFDDEDAGPIAVAFDDCADRHVGELTLRATRMNAD